MKFIPILFSTSMVQAILAGRKNQTRRVIKNISIVQNKHGTFNYKAKGCAGNNIPKDELLCDFLGIGSLCKYAVGDILWVRENFCVASHLDNQPIKIFSNVNEINYLADYNNTNIARFLHPGRTRPSIHMPKWACRLFLKVKDIRVERLQDVSKKAAKAEGVKSVSRFYECYLCNNNGHVGATAMCEDGFFTSATDSFRTLWMSINGQQSWFANPWVWVIEFERIEKPDNFC